MSDILDFTSYAKEVGLQTARTDTNGETFAWNEIYVLEVRKDRPKAIFVKTSYASEFREVPINRRVSRSVQVQESDRLKPLRSMPPKISDAKYADLMALCSGSHPVVRLHEHRLFYRHLPH